MSLDDLCRSCWVGRYTFPIQTSSAISGDIQGMKVQSVKAVVQGCAICSVLEYNLVCLHKQTLFPAVNAYRNTEDFRNSLPCVLYADVFLWA